LSIGYSGTIIQRCRFLCGNICLIEKLKRLQYNFTTYINRQSCMCKKRRVVREMSPLQSFRRHKRLTATLKDSFSLIRMLQTTFLGAFFPFRSFFGDFFRFFIGAGAVHAAEGGFFSIDDFSVASFIDLAAAVSTNVEAWLNGN
jgi:hypothetical protein